MTMLSLRFPIPVPISNPIHNTNSTTVTPLKSTSSFYSARNTRSQTRRSFLHSLPRCQSHALRASANAAALTGDQVDKGTFVAEGVEPLPEGLSLELMPRHVAVIMDGNARWAKQRGLPASAGHEAGVRALRRLTELCCMWGVKVLTVFAFSTDNWVRPKVEVDFLMSLFERALSSEMEKFAREGIKISMIGDQSKLPNSLKRQVSNAEETTKDNNRLQLIVAVSYSGKYDVVQACKSVAEKVRDGMIKLEDINENLIEQELETNCTEFPNPDLLIRTSGEHRVSNFLLWQLAYTELFFVRELWPDFEKDQFVEALTSFQQRQRRYGGRKS